MSVRSGIGRGPGAQRGSPHRAEFAREHDDAPDLIAREDEDEVCEYAEQNPEEERNDVKLSHFFFRGGRAVTLAKGPRICRRSLCAGSFFPFV